MTYSSPSRTMRVAIWEASDDATSGSVMQNADRISASSSGSSHSSFCSAVPNWRSSSMLPVSGAAQLNATGARRGLRPVSSATGAYCRLVEDAARQEQVPEAPLARRGLQVAHDRPGPPLVGGRGQLLLEHGLGGIDELVEEALRAVHVVDRHGVGGEVHQRTPASCARPSSASGVTRAPIRSKPSPTVSPARNRK